MVELRRDVVVSAIITIGLVTSLLAAAQPSAAAGVTVSGPDSVSVPETVTYTAAVEVPSDATLDGVTFALRPADGEDGEVVTIDVAPDGTVRSVTPERGVVGEGEIRVDRLRKSLDVTRLDRDDDSGYGYGYGYGYGDDERTVVFEIRLGARAFKQGEYLLRASATADGEPIEAGELQFTVEKPGESPGDGEDSNGDDGNEGDDGNQGDGNDGNDGDRNSDLRDFVRRVVSFVADLVQSIFEDRATNGHRTASLSR